MVLGQGHALGGWVVLGQRKERSFLCGVGWEEPACSAALGQNGCMAGKSCLWPLGPEFWKLLAYLPGVVWHRT